jgi:hypothetical protein
MVINVQISHTAVNRTGTPTVRLGIGAFWAIFGIVTLALATLTVVLVSSIPASTTLSNTADVEQVRAFILNSTSASDPLIEISPTVIERSSAIRGLSLRGQTYYYYFEGRESYDPFSRGRLREHQIERVLRDDGSSTPLVIYTVRGA